MIQRYNTESNSQPMTNHKELYTQLLLMIQRYNTESNSQLFSMQMMTIYVVADDSKIQYWKQFTTPMM